jgi:hypothetical protein
MNQHWRGVIITLFVGTILAAILVVAGWRHSKAAAAHAETTGMWIEQQGVFRIIPSPHMTPGDGGLVKIEMPDGYRLVSAPIPLVYAGRIPDAYCVTVTRPTDQSYMTVTLDLAKAMSRSGTETPTILWTTRGSAITH